MAFGGSPDGKSIAQCPHVERVHRSVEAFQIEFADILDIGGAVDCTADLGIDQDLATACLCAQPCRQVNDAANRGVVEPPLEADAAEGGVAMRNAHSEP